jgi:hypothetical protein
MLAVAAVAGLAGCVQAEATYLGPHDTLAPVPEEQVRVFLQSDSIPPNCTRLAMINLSGDASGTSEAQMIRAAKRRAGKIGANAVQLPAMRDPRTGTRIARAVFGPFVNADRKGQSVAFTCTQPQASLWDRMLSAAGFAD